MNFSDLFSRLGQGFGIVKALRTVTDRIETLRQRATEGALSPEEEAAEETFLVSRLGEYYNDPTWEEIVDLKQSGRIEEARDRANHLRRKYDL